ncbi:MAG: tryptophan-rich sensory protein [Xanthomonadales bacterium]|nr:tryptophan-rich sensory protein [Gammaproteobacteria bacterium]MBT8072546.1 tryptophan-rich sensory protein [Gammaproteobacteria bacterium]NNK03389.1 tryptophan-rich sensory protein [Xanthomonadales bacterium]NNL00209.1 tryptophan-rich sensory protein [Xanthomonadales bacterium]
MHRLTSLSLFLLLAMIAAAVGGQFTGGEWYQAMRQPPWSPPAVVMALVWALAYVMMAVAAWMVWDTRRGLARVALAWWVLQLLLGIGWSWVFFGMHRPGWALVVLAAWWLVVLVVIRTFRSVKTAASRLVGPVAIWLLFCWVLGFVQWRLNGGGI